MYKILIIALLSFTALMMAGIFFFQDGVLYEDTVDDMWKIPSGVTVLSVDSTWWKVESSRFNWSDVVKKTVLSRCEDPWSFGDQRILSQDPLVLTNGQKCFYFMEKPGIWTVFDCPSTEIGRFLRVSQRSKAVLFAEGGWKASYELRDGVLTFYGKFSSSVHLSGRVKLVSGRFFSESQPSVRYKGVETMAVGAAPAPTVKVAERRVYDLGELDIPKGDSTIRLFVGKPEKIEEIYLAMSSIRSSTDWMKAVYSLEMDNTKENGLGYPMPDGEVLVFQNGVPLGSFEFKGSPVGEKIKVLENRSDEILYKLRVDSSYRKGKRYVRDLTVILKNLSEKAVKIQLMLFGKGLRVLKSDIQPSEKADDYVIFKIDLDPGEIELKLTLESDY